MGNTYLLIIPLILEKRLKVIKVYHSPVRQQRAFFKGHREGL